MRVFLLLAAVLIGVLLWRSRRVAQDPGPQAPPPTEPQPQDMVACDLCGTHLPLADAVTGRRGVYCNAEHRQRAEP